MSAEYSVEQIQRAIANMRVANLDELEVERMLTAYADRIKADEGAVPVAEVYEYPREIQTWNSPMVRAVRFLCASPLPIGTKLFAHSPAQAAQLEAPPHCKGHMQFEYDCLDCSDVLERKRKASTAEPVAQGEVVLDADELAEFAKTIAEFNDCEMTETPQHVLMRWAEMGLLVCEQFELTKKGQAMLAAAPSPGESE